MTTSVKGNRNRAELVATILEHLPPAEAFEEAEGERSDTDPELKLAIVGRRNVGKSTFINVLAKSPRVITSEVPGTTRDSIDIRFDMDDKVFVAIDTPGVRKRKSMSSDIEYYGLVRAKRSIRRANVVMMFFDSQETISRVDKQLVEEIVKHHKPCVFVVNKWDLAVDAEMTIEKWSDYLLKSFSTMRHAPVAFITAIDDHNTKQLINLTQTIFKQARQRVGTPRLNKIIRAAMLNNMPPMRKNRRPKIYYATQVSVEPPTIVLKCNEPGLFDPSWKRYLLGVLREETPFQEVPIQLYMRAKVRSDGPAKSLEEEELDPVDESSDSNIVSDTLSY
jgi:GTP-binding protein